MMEEKKLPKLFMRVLKETKTIKQFSSLPFYSKYRRVTRSDINTLTTSNENPMQYLYSNSLCCAWSSTPIARGIWLSVCVKWLLAILGDGYEIQSVDYYVINMCLQSGYAEKFFTEEEIKAITKLKEKYEKNEDHSN